MWRVLGVIDEMSDTLRQASSLLSEVLTTIDHELTHLQVRLNSDAAELRAVVENDSCPNRDQKLVEVTDRIEKTAAQVAAFAHRPSDPKNQIAPDP